MNCPQIQKLIQAHHDGELDAANTLQVDEHLADCPQCFDALRRLSTLRGALQNDALRFTAPAGLRARIRASVAQTATSEQEPVRARPWFQSMGWVAAAIAVVVSILTLTMQPARDGDRLVAELTASHVRSLMAAHLTDVASTDQHTVKPWFDGKLDFAPPVRDLRETGFPLLGGRLDFIDGRPAAALVYGRQKHFINLFVWPAKTAAPRKLTTTQRNGYNLAQWSDGKMEFSAVSDLNEADLRVFVSEWQGR
ncbi:MAG TPA: anti-sigma factor [Chthoniobacteraceae bacterium]|jgi:anti-sigma factor RsiW|nr:anti-sigma factor [Chthoniobacteraceae bacterium]